MGKAKLIIGIIVFAIFVIVGFCIAGQLPNMLNIPTLPAQKQQNYLIIHVDSLTQTSPKIVSLWMISVSNDPAITSLKAQTLYPSTATQSAFVMQSFLLNSKGQPTQEFLTLIQSTFQLSINNYIMIDSEGLAILRSLWLDVPPTTIESYADGALLFSQGCERIRKNQVNRDSSQAWAQIIPDHCRTDLTFDDAILRWNELIRAGSKLNCEVFSPQP
jgi:hypothetical protein